MIGKGEQPVDLVHVNDVADAVSAGILDKKSAGKHTMLPIRTIRPGMNS